jgi:hypothetical protein
VALGPPRGRLLERRRPARRRANQLPPPDARNIVRITFKDPTALAKLIKFLPEFQKTHTLRKLLHDTSRAMPLTTDPRPAPKPKPDSKPKPRADAKRKT